MTIDSRVGPVAVIGAAGQQGGATVDALLKAGAKVRAAVRDPKVANLLEAVPVAFVRPRWFMEDLPSKL